MKPENKERTDTSISPVANIAEGIFKIKPVSINSLITGSPMKKLEKKKINEMIEKNNNGRKSLNTTKIVFRTFSPSETVLSFE